MAGSSGHGGRSRQPRAHVSTTGMKQKVNCKWIKLFVPKACPSGILSPARPSHLHLPKQCHQPGTKCSDALDYGGGHFTVKPLLPGFLHLTSHFYQLKTKALIVWGGVAASCVWRSECMWELVLSLFCVSPENWTQFIRVGRMSLYLRSHLPDPDYQYF